MLLGPNGQPISTQAFKKASPPALGPSYGNWAGRDTVLNQMPGGAILQFDLSQLTLADYRAMKYHPQLNASLSILTFMLHQIDWYIECEDNRIADEFGENLEEVWTRLIRAMSQAFWAGFSPTVIEWENDVNKRRIVMSKFKDLAPEECKPNWKEVEGAIPPADRSKRTISDVPGVIPPVQEPAGRRGRIPPKLKVFDGIKQQGFPYPIPVENSLWYPLLMENGDYYGRKLLKAAFAPWYFSILIHLYANRYFERFGEPLPIGRAPFDETVDTGEAEPVPAKTAIETILMNLRNRGVVALPADRDPVTKDYEWDIQYLESQMRGADFDRYMDRLDEEMSLALFTPVLLFKTGDVGSNNLGVQHTQTWLWMLNAVAGDLKEYITRYVAERWKAINYSPRAPALKWKPRKLGKENVDTMRAVIAQLLRNGTVKVDLEDLGQALGMKLTEVRQVTSEDNPDEDTRTDRSERDRSSEDQGVDEPRATGREVAARLRKQVAAAFKNGTFGPDFAPSFGYEKRMVKAFCAEGIPADKAKSMVTELYSRMDQFVREAASIGMEEYSGPSDFMSLVERCLDREIVAIAE